MKSTQYENELFKKYGIDKLSSDIKSKILERKNTTHKQGYRDTIKECEDYIIQDVKKILKEENQFAIEFLTTFIGQRLRTIEYHETGLIQC